MMALSFWILPSTSRYNRLTLASGVPAVGTRDAFTAIAFDSSVMTQTTGDFDWTAAPHLIIVKGSCLIVVSSAS